MICIAGAAALTLRGSPGPYGGANRSSEHRPPDCISTQNHHTGRSVAGEGSLSCLGARASRSLVQGWPGIQFRLVAGADPWFANGMNKRQLKIVIGIRELTLNDMVAEVIRDAFPAIDFRFSVVKTVPDFIQLATDNQTHLALFMPPGNIDHDPARPHTTPEEEAVHIVRTIKARHPIPVIVIAAHPVTAEAFLEAGTDHFLHAPARPEEITKALAACLRSLTEQIHQQLPCLNKCGYLPPGIYEVSLTDIQNMFARGSNRREQLWKNFLRFLDWAKGTGAFQALEIGGSFLTAKSEPSDIDVALELRRVAVPVEAALLVLTDDRRNQIKEDYGVQVLVKELNSEPYNPHAPSTFSFATNRLLLFRVLRKEELLRVGAAEGRQIPRTEEYRGFIRIDL